MNWPGGGTAGSWRVNGSEICDENKVRIPHRQTDMNRDQVQA